MLAQQRRGSARLARGGGELDRHSHRLHAAGARVLDFDHHLARLHLGIGEHVADAVDRPHGHARLLEGADPFRRRALAQALGDERNERGQVLHAIAVGPEARILRKPGAIDHLHDALPVRLVRAADVDPAVARRERLVGRGEDVRRSGRAGIHAGGEEDRRLPVGLLDRRFHERGLDPLAAACGGARDERRDDSQRGKDAGVDVGDRGAAFGGRAAGLAGDAHDSREALRDQVEAALVGVRAGPSVPGNGAIDQARIQLPQHVISEAESLERSLAVVLRHDIGIGEEALHHLQAARRLQVHGHAAFVAVQDHEGGRLALDRGLGVAARVVSARKLFNLYDVRAHVGEQHPARRPGHNLRQFDDLDSLQRSHGALRVMRTKGCGTQMNS